MKNFFLLVVLVALLGAGYYYRESLPFFAKKADSGEESGDKAPSSEKKPPGTPNPAPDSQAAAIRAYPGLAIKDSALNKKFRELYVETERNNPELLTRADWPFTLAAQAAKLLGGGAMPTPGATPPPLSGWSLKGSSLDVRPEKAENGGGKKH